MTCTYNRSWNFCNKAKKLWQKFLRTDKREDFDNYQKHVKACVKTY